MTQEITFLSKAVKPRIKPPMITIIGTPGVGKTSLGALFPNPVFLPTEDGAAVFDSWDNDKTPAFLPRVPRPTGGDKIITRSSIKRTNEYLDELLSSEHDYKTLVVDSITSLDRLFALELTILYDVKTVADASGGFHKGFAELASLHANFVYKCEVLRTTRQMGIVFLAHVGVQKLKNRPDQAADFTVYGLDMDTASAGVYVSQSDAVLYLTQEEVVLGAAYNDKDKQIKAGRVKQGNDRKLITSGDGMIGFVNAKNRFNMPTEISVGYMTNPILDCIKFYKGE